MFAFCIYLGIVAEWMGLSKCQKKLSWLFTHSRKGGNAKVGQQVKLMCVIQSEFLKWLYTLSKNSIHVDKVALENFTLNCDLWKPTLESLQKIKGLESNFSPNFEALYHKHMNQVIENTLSLKTRFPDILVFCYKIKYSRWLYLIVPDIYCTMC